MDHEKSLANSSSDPDILHVEQAGKHGRDITDPSYVDHRADDDRADEAKGRNADKIDKSYWLSVNFIGTLFAIGMAFMGGIGGELLKSSTFVVDIALTTTPLSAQAFSKTRKSASCVYKSSDQ